MKKFFTTLLSIALLCCLTLTMVGCEVKTTGKSTDGDVAVPEQSPSREISLKANESYNLIKQLEFENLDVENAVLSFDDEDISLQTGNFDCSYFAINNGVITAKDVDFANLSTDCEASNCKLKTANNQEDLVIKVVDRQKFGDTYLKVDVGRLYGKKVVFFGDSITDQNAVWWTTNTWYKVTKEGKYYRDNGGYVTMKGITENYVNMLDNVCHFKWYYNPAVAGALCSHYNAAYANKNISIPTQLKNSINKIKEADYVFIMGGTNDSYEINKTGAVLKLGDPSDMATEEAFAEEVNTKPLSTFYGFYNYILNTIRNETDAGIIVLSNIPCQSSYGYYGGVTNGHNNQGIQGINQAIEISASNYKAIYIDLYSSLPCDEKTGKYISNWFTNDELHPNPVAYERMTDRILSVN